MANWLCKIGIHSYEEIYRGPLGTPVITTDAELEIYGYGQKCRKVRYRCSRCGHRKSDTLIQY